MRVDYLYRRREDAMNHASSSRVLDELTENANRVETEVLLDVDQELWIDHSPHVMITRRCRSFVKN